MLTISKSKPIDEVVAKFVIKTQSVISGEPDYDSLKKNIQAIYGHAATLPTNLAGRKHGHVGLIMKENMYSTWVTVTPWEDLDELGASQPLLKIPQFLTANRPTRHTEKHTKFSKTPQPCTRLSSIT